MVNNKLKYIQRSILRPKLQHRCTCCAKICVRSQVLVSFGVNDSNNERILLKDLKVEEISIDHIWVKCEELNDVKRYRKGLTITFTALISSYQKIGGRVGIGLFDIKDIEIEN